VKNGDDIVHTLRAEDSGWVGESWKVKVEGYTLQVCRRARPPATFNCQPATAPLAVAFLDSSDDLSLARGPVAKQGCDHEKPGSVRRRTGRLGRRGARLAFRVVMVTTISLREARDGNMQLLVYRSTIAVAEQHVEVDVLRSAKLTRWRGHASRRIGSSWPIPEGGLPDEVKK